MMSKRKRGITEVHETPSPYLTDEELIRILEERLPRLLEQKPELRQKLKLLLPDLATKEDIKAILEEMKRMREDWERRFQALREEVNILREEVNILKEEVNALKEEVNILREEIKALRREMYEELARLRKEIHEELKKIREDFHNTVSAVGSRWGENIEESFRLGLGTILRESFGVDAQQIWIEDREGWIKGYPARYQVDLLVTNSHHILIEIKSSAGDLDVNKLHRLGKLYEKERGVKPRLILLTGYARPSAQKEAQMVGDVEILTKVEDVRERGRSTD